MLTKSIVSDDIFNAMEFALLRTSVVCIIVQCCSICSVCLILFNLFSLFSYLQANDDVKVEAWKLLESLIPYADQGPWCTIFTMGRYIHPAKVITGM